MWPAASKLSRLRPFGYTRTPQIIARGPAVLADFAVTFEEYVYSNDGSAVVPTKPVKTPENGAKHAAWSIIHRPAAKYRSQYLNRTLSQEELEQGDRHLNPPTQEDPVAAGGNGFCLV
jgi:hypothetical protein